MDAHIHDILVQNDSPTDVEYPSGFDWQASIAAVKALKPQAERILGQPLKLDDQVQDASFFAELFVFEDGAVGPNGVTTMVFKIAIRFSTLVRWLRFTRIQLRRISPSIQWLVSQTFLGCTASSTFPPTCSASAMMGS